MKKLCAFIILWLCCSTLPAKVLPDIYQAEVPVASRSDAARREAVHAALLDVLVKASGHAAIASKVVLPQDTQSVVQSYAYLPQALAEENAAPSWRLKVQFNPSSIQTLLAPEKAWAVDRPLLVMWLAAPKAEQAPSEATPVLLAGEVRTDIQQALQRAAALRGLPLAFPNPQAAVEAAGAALNISDILTPNWPVLAAQSQPYHGDGLVAGQFTEQGDGAWQGTLSLRFDDAVQTWQATGETLDMLAASLIGELTEHLADHFATKLAATADAEPKQVRLLVQTEMDIQSFAKLQRYLNRLAAVQAVTLTRMSSTEVQFELQLRDSQSALTQQIALDHYLQRLSATGAPLTYRVAQP